MKIVRVDKQSEEKNYWWRLDVFNIFWITMDLSEIKFMKIVKLIKRNCKLWTYFWFHAKKMNLFKDLDRIIPSNPIEFIVINWIEEEGNRSHLRKTCIRMFWHYSSYNLYHKLQSLVYDPIAYCFRWIIDGNVSVTIYTLFVLY